MLGMKAGILQVIFGEGHPKPAEYRVGVDGRLYLQKGWKEFVIESCVKSHQVVVLNFFEVGGCMFEIMFGVIGQDLR